MSSLMQKFEPNSRQTLVALMMFLGVVCLTGGVTAQSIIDFEQPDSSDAEACDFVTTQYQAQFGIRFENVDASGNPLDPPQFARVGGVSTWDGTSFTGCAYEGFPVGPFVNRSGGGFGSGVHLNHVSDCYFPADECSASFPTPDFVADYDTPVYDEGALPPRPGHPLMLYTMWVAGF